MKTAVFRIIEGMCEVEIDVTTPFKFASPDSMFAIELADDEELMQMECTGIPQSLRHRPATNSDGVYNQAYAVYLFRGLAVSTVDKSAVEVMADIASAQEANRHDSIDAKQNSVTDGEDEDGEGLSSVHARPLPGEEER